MHTLQLTTETNGIATVTLNRPDKHNAMSAQMISELDETARLLAADSQVRVVILAAAGKSFCAGGDLGWMQQQIDADRAGRMAEARRLAMMLHRWNTLDKPTIARVQGNAFGGGIGLMCVCDHVIATDDARFGLTETRLGLIPATISPYVIARMGEGLARRVFMSARIFGAAEARSLQLVATVVTADQIDEAVSRESGCYLKVAPGAVAAAKSLARFLGPGIDETLIDATIARLADTWETEEAAEGIDAFLRKRPARWQV